MTELRIRSTNIKARFLALLATKSGKITAAEGIRDSFLKKKKVKDLRTRSMNIKALAQQPKVLEKKKATLTQLKIRKRATKTKDPG